MLTGTPRSGSQSWSVLGAGLRGAEVRGCSGSTGSLFPPVSTAPAGLVQRRSQPRPSCSSPSSSSDVVPTALSRRRKDVVSMYSMCGLGLTKTLQMRSTRETCDGDLPERFTRGGQAAVATPMDATQIRSQTQDPVSTEFSVSHLLKAI